MRTCLFGVHVRAGARIVDFNGWDMPLLYTGIVEEHRRVRTAVGLFDISHMGRLRVSGPDALPLLQDLLPFDVEALPAGRIKYSLLLNERGGVLDDVLVYRHADHASLVVNAGNRAKCLEWLERRRGTRRVTVTDRTTETAMVAVQGPAALAVSAAFVGEPLEALKYYTFAEHVLPVGPVLVSRTGYTGEDGVELIVPAVAGERLWNALLDVGKDRGIGPTGLGARDTLRLEAGMPLYGHELSEEITPLEAGLERAIQVEKPGYVGREALLAQRAAGLSRVRVGLRVADGRKIPRQGCPVEAGGREVGIVTSGTFSPTLEVPIAMAAVRPEAAAPGAEVRIRVRERDVPAHVVPLPFYRRRRA